MQIPRPVSSLTVRGVQLLAVASVRRRAMVTLSGRSTSEFGVIPVRRQPGRTGIGSSLTTGAYDCSAFGAPWVAAMLRARNSRGNSNDPHTCPHWLNHAETVLASSSRERGGVPSANSRQDEDRLAVQLGRARCPARTHALAPQLQGRRALRQGAWMNCPARSSSKSEIGRWIRPSPHTAESPLRSPVHTEHKAGACHPFPSLSSSPGRSATLGPLVLAGTASRHSFESARRKSTELG
jgi:hypothetical protein